MSNAVFCTISEYVGSFIIVIGEDNETREDGGTFLVKRSTSPKSQPYLLLKDFLEADDLSIPPEAKTAVRDFLEEEETQREKLRAKIRVGGKMYPSTRAYFDDHFNRVIDAVVRHPKFKKKVGRE